MAAYVKLFGSILQSTVWEEDPATKVVWITMLALADRNGEVMASVPGLARSAGVPRAAVERALARFMGPDKDSRTKHDGGRRIEEIDGGWLVLNYAKYREMSGREDQMRKNAERQRRYRERMRGVTSHVTDRNAPITSVTQNRSPSPSPPPHPDQRGKPPLGRAGAGPRPGPRNGHDLIAGTDAKLAEMRAAAGKAATPAELEALRAERNGGAA